MIECIKIFEIAENCGIKEFSNIDDLAAEFKKKLKRPQYIIGFLKYKNLITDINIALDMLSEKVQSAYKVTQRSGLYGEEKEVIFDDNDELNLYIQLSRILEGRGFLTKQTQISVIKEMMVLSENNILIGLYFLIQLHYMEYITLDSELLVQVYAKIKKLADGDFYLDKNYKKIAQRLENFYGERNTLCHYALKLPLFVGIYEYKRNDINSSFQYLIRMLQVAKDYEIKYEEKVISLFEELYISYEVARRLAYGEGIESDVERACYMTEAILRDSTYVEDDILETYIFESPSKKQISIKDFNTLLYNLLDYTCKKRNVETSNQQDYRINDLFERQEEAPFTEAKCERNWDRVNELIQSLDDMQGLNAVKRKVHEIVDGIKVAEYKQEHFGDESDSLGTMHLIFTGNAGTGKTTVARILGKIYGALGILENEDLFVECGRADLVGEYLGHTAPKVKKMVDSAIGGILFIDEAYALTMGSDAFGIEAVNTLVAEVENHRNELIVILAGYKNEMHNFLKSNQGLSSRFCTEISFEDYTPKDMVEIIKKMGEEEQHPKFYKQEVENYLFEFFKKKSLDNESDFGNARGVRNTFEAMSRQKASRVAEMIQKGMEPTKDDIYIFQLEDVIRCSVCGSLMNIRDGKYGKFMSCKNYTCNNTMSVERYYK